MRLSEWKQVGPGLVFVDVVGAEAAGTLEEVFGVAHGEGADDDRMGLVANVHHPNQLGVVLAVHPNGFLSHHHEVPVEQGDDGVGEAGEGRGVVDVA